VSCSL